MDDVEKLDLYSHKNAKYLLYRFNDYIETSGGKKNKPSSIPQKLKYSTDLKKIEEISY